MDADGNDLRRRVAAHLTAATGEPADLISIARLPGGACQDNFEVNVTLAAGPLIGTRRFVLRSDAPSSLPRSIRRMEEFTVINAAVAAGVMTPQARWLAHDLVRPGSSAYLLDWVDGEAVGRRVVGSPKLEKARAGLAEACAEQLARIHSITPSTHPHLFSTPPPANPATEAIAAMHGMLDELPEPHPAIELALRWLQDHPPRRSEVTLIHGDFRTGNLMVSPNGLEAVLDWEFAQWGSPEEDLAWLCVRDWRFNRLDKPVGGFADRRPFVSAYQRASGRTVEPEDLLFWEVVGNVRWAIGSVYQGERYLSGAQDDIELLAIARRAIEMEFEALRLIEQGV